MTPKSLSRATHIALFSSLAMAGGIGLAQEPADQTIVVKGKPLPEGVETRIVKISDLNLAVPDGEKEMNRRVEAAVESICNKSATQDLSGKALDEKCRDEAWAGARPQMDRAVQLARSR